MLSGFPWAELVVAFVRLEAAAVGWCVVRVRRARTSASVYVELEGRAGGRATVRVSDHPPRRGSSRRESMLAVAPVVPSRLDCLRAFLAGRTGRVLGVK